MSKASESSPAVPVTDPRAVRSLTDLWRFRYLIPFLGREATVKAAAAETGTSVLTMYRWVTRFQELGLVRVTREEPRRGRATKYYRSSADAFYVPFAATSSETVESFVLESDDRFRRLLHKGLAKHYQGNGPELGVRIFRDDGERPRFVLVSGGVEVQPMTVQADDPLKPAVWSDWSIVTLSQQDAKALQQAMRALWEVYQRPATKGRQYVVRMAMAPLVDQLA
ncbi:MAG TPA: hypothetical protein VNT60_01435 [Deinococcales bacterium]|nr:hypothetical protein [Deinococcales bacterium]